MPDYIFDNAAAETEQRFGALEALFDPVTIRHLEPFVVPGAHCLEVGGGSGSIARWMSDRVGATGHVLVTDLNTRFLDDITAANVEVRRHDILADPLDDNAFDVAHTRLVLVHLPERKRAIERLIAALKPGGHLVLQEFDVVSTRLDPTTFPDETALKLIVVFPEVMFARGVNNRFGRELFPLLVSMGLADVAAEGHATMFRGGSAGARLMRANFEQLHDAIIATGRITEEEFQQDLIRLDDPATIWPSQILWTVRARKP